MNRKNYMMGGWVDERVPREEIAVLMAPLGVDASAFCDWLAPHVGNYRSWTEMDREMPTRKEELAVLRDYQKVMEAAIHYLTPGGLTPFADAEMTNEWWKFTKTMIHEVERDLASKLRYLMVMAEKVESKFEGQAGKRGKKADPRKARLLASVADWLHQQGVGAARARSTAAKVLSLCGLQELPDTKVTLRRAAKRGTQLQK